MNTDQIIVKTLKRAMEGEAPEFKKAAEEGIKEKKSLAAARPTAMKEMKEKIKRLKKNEGKKNAEEGAEVANGQQDSYLHLLAMMAKVVEEEEAGPSSSTAAAPASPTAP
ncbi:hypothetical protein CRE_16995 [Caenorhabditis remanei]|uniref:Uncharacterized protein n=1 Tax=Caenorhabditis remanei TaxID=31234 RepID=E3N7V8_CAERE|nr:hypothetical protein CRE_16995 [Caenorhabditis remanei]